jgi:hypothetical protein
MRLNRKQLWFTELFFGRFYPSARRWAQRNGYEMMVTEVWRAEATARANAEAGTGIVNSNHRKKLAVDVILWKDGEPVWDWTAYRPLGEIWKAMSCMVNARDKLTCCWGGDFGRRKDGHHFSFLHNGVK